MIVGAEVQREIETIMEVLMSEKYQEFNAADYVKSDADIRELLRAATDEDLGDGAVIRAVLKHVAEHRT